MCEMVLGLKPGIWHYVYVRCYVVYLEPNITVSGQDGGAPKVPSCDGSFLTGSDSEPEGRFGNHQVTTP